MSNHGLPGANVERATFVLNAQSPFQYDRELVELGSLPRLDPSSGTAHVSDARGGRLRVHASNVFVDQLGFVASGFDSGRLRDECRHVFVSDTGSVLPGTRHPDYINPRINRQAESTSPRVIGLSTAEGIAGRH